MAGSGLSRTAPRTTRTAQTPRCTSACPQPSRPGAHTRAARLRKKDCGEIFYTLQEAKVVIESWRRHYNAVRPHASLGYRPPAPEVFVPAFAAWPPAPPRPASPARLTLAQRPTLN